MIPEFLKFGEPGRLKTKVFVHPVFYTGDTSLGALRLITNMTSTLGLSVGQTVAGTNIPASTTIVSIDSATQVTIDKDVTGTATGTSLTFSGNIVWTVPSELILISGVGGGGGGGGGHATGGGGGGGGSGEGARFYPFVCTIGQTLTVTLGAGGVAGAVGGNGGLGEQNTLVFSGAGFATTITKFPNFKAGEGGLAGGAADGGRGGASAPGDGTKLPFNAGGTAGTGATVGGNGGHAFAPGSNWSSGASGGGGGSTIATGGYGGNGSFPGAAAGSGVASGGGGAGSEFGLGKSGGVSGAAGTSVQNNSNNRYYYGSGGGGGGQNAAGGVGGAGIIIINWY
jgi:hypothetical protein